MTFSGTPFPGGYTAAGPLQGDEEILCDQNGTKHTTPAAIKEYAKLTALLPLGTGGLQVPTVPVALATTMTIDADIGTHFVVTSSISGGVTFSIGAPGLADGFATSVVIEGVYASGSVAFSAPGRSIRYLTDDGNAPTAYDPVTYYWVCMLRDAAGPCTIARVPA
jgi:hypothetical protein